MAQAELNQSWTHK